MNFWPEEMCCVCFFQQLKEIGCLFVEFVLVELHAPRIGEPGGGYAPGSQTD